MSRKHRRRPRRVFRMEQLEPRRLLAGLAGTVHVDKDDPVPDIGFCGDMDNPCNTIQLGIANAAPNDTVLISGGTYEENVVIGKNLTLRGGAADIVSPGDEIKIQPPVGTGPAITVQSSADCVVIDTITAVSVGDTAIDATEVGDLTLRNVSVFLSSTAAQVVGGGNLTVEGGQYLNNGVGILALALTGDVVFAKFLADDVTIESTADEGILIEDARDVTIEDTSVSEGRGIGISLKDVRDVVMRSSTVEKNDMQGMSVENVRSFKDTDSQFLKNKFGGVTTTDVQQDVVLNGSLFQDNDADGNNSGDGFVASALDELHSIGGKLEVIDAVFDTSIGGSQSVGLGVGSVAGNISISGTTVEGHTRHGIELFDPLAEVRIENLEARGNGLSGLRIADFNRGGQKIDIVGGGFQRNEFGIDIDLAADVTLDGVETLDNTVGIVGVRLSSFKDTNGDNHGNLDGGIHLTDITGNVELVNTTATDNNANGDNQGSGVEAIANNNASSIGGNLIVRGGMYADSTPQDGNFDQNFGLFVTQLGGNLTVTAGPGGPMTGKGHVGGAAIALTEPSGEIAVSDAVFEDNLFGLFVDDVFHEVSATNVVAARNEDSAISVTTGVDVTIDGGQFTENGVAVSLTQVGVVTTRNNPQVLQSLNAGLKVNGSHQVRLNSGAFSETTDGNGILLERTGNIELTGVTADKNQANGLLVVPDPASPPTLDVQGGSFSNNGGNCAAPCGVGFSASGTLGVQLTGLSANENLSHGIDLVNPSGNVVISGGVFNNSQNGSGIRLSGAANVAISNGATADGNAMHGLVANPNTAGAATIAVDSGSFSGNTLNGIFTEGYQTVNLGANVNASGNQGHGASVLPDQTNTTAMVVNGGIYSTNQQHGISVVGVEDLSLSGTSANGNTGSGLGATSLGQDTLNISGGTFDGNGGAAGIDTSGYTSVSLTGGVQANGNAANGAWISSQPQGPGQVLINGATFNGTTGGEGLLLQGTIQVNGQNITANGNSTEGIRVAPNGEGDATVILANSSFSGNGTGILLQDTTVATLTGLTVDSNSGSGLQIPLAGGGVNLGISGGSYSNNQAGDGIQLERPSQLTVDNIVASGNSVTGLVVLPNGSAAGDIAISNSQFSGNLGDDGIHLISVGAIGLDNVTATENQRNGLSVGDAGDIGINGGAFSANQTDGIVLAASGSVTIRGGTEVNNNAGVGLFLNDVGTVELTGTSLTSNGAAGLDAALTSDVILSSVAATGNTADGLLIDSAGAVALNAGAASTNARGFNISNVQSLTITDQGFFGNSSGVGGTINNVPTVELISTDTVVDEVSLTATTIDITQLRNPDVVLDQVVYANVQTLRVDGGPGDDLALVSPSASTSFEIDGNEPVAPALPGDTLRLDALGAAVTATDTQVLVAGFLPITYTSVETFDFTNRLRPWRNPFNPLDVDNDGRVVPKDVLLLINDINSNQIRTLPVPPVPEPPPYLDVNGDGSISPIDVLLVINFVNNNVGGEGEAAVARLADAVLSEPADRASSATADRLLAATALSARTSAADSLPNTLRRPGTGEFGDSLAAASEWSWSPDDVLVSTQASTLTKLATDSVWESAEDDDWWSEGASELAIDEWSSD